MSIHGDGVDVSGNYLGHFVITLWTWTDEQDWG